MSSSKPIVWGGTDLFTHMLIVGSTGTGKTATILKPLIYQLLILKKKGVPLGFSVIEPKGDVAQFVADVAEEMGLDYTHIDPYNPNSAKFNPMEGETNAVAEATVVVLKGLFGKQDAFFATIQELSARNVTKLLKILRGDNLDITDVMNTLRDPHELERCVKELKRLGGHEDLIHFFESELLGSMADRYRQFVIGLRAQLENIVSNDALRRIMTGKSSIDMDEHFEKGGILAVNTALGMLRTSGDAFGQFVTMHLQNATLRRPGDEDTRIPHFMIVDEYSRYINPDVEIFLSIARSYRVAGIFALQSLSQLEVESGKYSGKQIKNSILMNTRNKIVFGGAESDDAKTFSEIFGEDRIILRQSTYKFNTLLPNLFPASYRDTETTEVRFSPTDIMDGLPRFTFIAKLMQNGRATEPQLGLGTFVPKNWRELREWEQKPKEESGLLKRVLNSFRKEKEKEEKNPFELTEEVIEQLEEETANEVQSLAQSEQAARTEEQLFEAEREKHGLLHADKKEHTNNSTTAEQLFSQEGIGTQTEQLEQEPQPLQISSNPKVQVEKQMDQKVPSPQNTGQYKNEDDFW